MRKFVGVLAFVAITMPALAGDKKDIVDTAAGAEGFKTLVAAVKAAGLVDTLKSDGPFTVLRRRTRHSPSFPRGLSRVCSSLKTKISLSQFSSITSFPARLSPRTSSSWTANP